MINSLQKKEFLPTVFVETSEHWEIKKAALACYPSQDELGRIKIQDINDHEHTYAESFGEQRVEAFEASYSDPMLALSLLRQFALPSIADSVIAVAEQDSNEAYAPKAEWWA